MKLKIGTLELGGRANLVLCDENGVILPGQTDVQFTQPANGPQRLTVTFIVDGERVIFDPSLKASPSLIEGDDS